MSHDVGYRRRRLLVVIIVLLLIMVFLAVAETGINRISKVKAEALAHEGTRRARRPPATRLEPERFLNPVLLTVNYRADRARRSSRPSWLDELFGTVGPDHRLRAQRRRLLRARRGACPKT